MPKRGEKHHNANLTDEQVKDMRQLYASWKAAGSNNGYGTLGYIFRCGASTARDIVTYRTRIDAERIAKGPAESRSHTNAGFGAGATTWR